MLEIDKLHKSFWQGQKKIDVLKDLSLSVSQGEKVAILGQSGSGKSTLLSLLAGVELELQQQPIGLSPLCQKSLSKRLGYSFCW